MKKITRTCEVVEYSVVMFDNETDEISKSNYTDFESIPEKDLKRALNAMLADKGDTRQVVKLVPINATAGLREMSLADFVKYSTPVVKKAADNDE